MTIMMITIVIMVKLIMTMTMIFVVVNNVFRSGLLDGSGYSLMCCEGRQLYVMLRATIFCFNENQNGHMTGKHFIERSHLV